MQKIFFTPGPTHLYPTVSKHIHNALKEDILSVSHRGEKFHQICSEVIANLRKLLKIPQDYHIFFLSSGTEAMERIIENTVSKHSLHFVNGAFSGRFYQTAVELGKEPIKIEANPGYGFDFGNLKIPDKAEVVCFTHNETSTGVALPLGEIYKIKSENPKKLIALDTVSSAPYVDVNFKYIDLCFFSVQKGFGLPAGLGVLIVSPQALRKYKLMRNKNYSAGSYHNFDSLLKYEEKNETPETPNVLAIYLLGKVVSDMLKIGIKRIRTQTEEKAKLLYDFFQKNPTYKIFVKEKTSRSNTVIVADVNGGSKLVIEKLKKRGFIIGSGYGEFKETQIRIANFPAHSEENIRRLLHALDNP